MITRKRLALNDDFVPLSRWSVETGQQEMEIARQGSHQNNLLRGRTHQRRESLGPDTVYMQIRREKRILMPDKVTRDALDSPRAEILVKIFTDILGLHSQ